MTKLRQTGHLNREERRVSTEGVSDWKVLVVDDQPDNIKVVALTLNFHGADIQTAKHGIEGLKILETYEPTFILLDLSMPEMNGWEMFAKLRTNPKFADTPVIALTAHAMEGDKESVMKAGFTGYIAKPFSVLSIISEIKNILANTPEEVE